MNNDNFDKKHISENWKDDQEVIRQNSILLTKPEVQMLFAGYYYDDSITKKPESLHLKKTMANQSTKAKTGNTSVPSSKN